VQEGIEKSQKQYRSVASFINSDLGEGLYKRPDLSGWWGCEVGDGATSEKEKSLWNRADTGG